MSLWMENLNELKHYHDLQREAEKERLVRQALEGHPKNQMMVYQGLSWLGSHLHAWGEHLLEHYGTAAATTTLVQRDSN